MEKEKEENIWKRKRYFCGEVKSRRKRKNIIGERKYFLVVEQKKNREKRRTIFGEQKYFGEGKVIFAEKKNGEGGKHLFVEEKEKGNICWRRRKNTEKENIIEKENWRGWTGGWRGRRLYTRSSRI